MGLENAGVIDAAGIEKDSGALVLTIADAWDWTDLAGHLGALQEKLNRYLGAVEAGK